MNACLKQLVFICRKTARQSILKSSFHAPFKFCFVTHTTQSDSSSTPGPAVHCRPGPAPCPKYIESWRVVRRLTIKMSMSSQ